MRLRLGWFVLLLSLLAWYTAPGISLRKAEAFGLWSAPTNVASINTEWDDTYAVLSKDGLTMYFTSNRPGGLGGNDLWVAKRESLGDPWKSPTNMTAINTDADDSLPALSSDEHVMFFSSTRAGCGAGDIWLTRRHDTRSEDWGPPVNVGAGCGVVNTDKPETAPALFENPETGAVTLFYGRDRSEFTDFDIYASAVGEDGYFGPGVLVPELSSPLRDTRTFFRKDGLEAFVTSNREGGLGKIDIWVSTRNTLSDPWSTPEDVGSPVNSPSDDGSPWLSRDGTTLYFFSNRVGGHGGRDIWCSTRLKIAGE